MGKLPDAEHVISAVASYGALGIDDTGKAWFLPHADGSDPDKWKPPVGVKSPAFLHILHTIDARIPPVKRMAKDYLDAAEVQAARLLLKQVQWASWDDRAKTLRYCLNPRFILEVSPAGIRALPNTGALGVYVCPADFLPLRWADLVEGLHSANPAQAALHQAVLDDLPAAAPIVHNPQHQPTFIKAWWLGLLVEPAVQGRPMLGLIGGTGSGKSVTARILGRIYYGPEYDVSGGAGGSRGVKDLVAMANHQPVVIADDQNDLPREIVDTLCRVATGAKITISTLHETLALSTFTARGALAITSNRPSWALRDDLMERILPVLFVRSKNTAGSIPDSERYRRATDARSLIWAEGLLAVQMTLADTRSWVASTRFTDWEQWVRRMAEVGGWHTELHEALGGQRRACVAMACWADDTMAVLYSLAEEMRESPRWMTASDLYDAVVMRLGGVVSSEAVSRPSARALSNPRALGIFLSMINREGSTVVHVERGPVHHGASTYCIVPKA